MAKLLQHMDQHGATLEDIKHTCEDLVRRVRHLEENI